MFDLVCYYPKQTHIAITQKQPNFVKNALANGCQRVMAYNIRPRAAKGLKIASTLIAKVDWIFFHVGGSNDARFGALCSSSSSLLLFFPFSSSFFSGTDLEQYLFDTSVVLSLFL